MFVRRMSVVCKPRLEVRSDNESALIADGPRLASGLRRLGRRWDAGLLLRTSRGRGGTDGVFGVRRPCEDDDGTELD